VLSVVIPSYSRRDGMLALLTDLHRQQDVEFEIVVVDDGSPDDSVQAIRNAFPSVRLLVNDSNAGPAVARNRGIREARGEWLIGFDSDVALPDPTLLARIAARIEENPGVDGLALRILRPDGPAQNGVEGLAPIGVERTDDIERWWHPHPIETHAGRAFFTSYFSGTAYAFRRAAVLGAGLYPEILYMHYEEVELAWRVLDRGGRILYTPDLAVVHHANPVSRRSQVEVFLKPRNQVLLAVSCLPWTAAAGYVIPRTAYQGAKAFWHGHFTDFARAMASAARLMPQQLKQRRPLRRSTLRKIRALKKGAAEGVDERYGQRDARGSGPRDANGSARID
jgi:GT2 family glycosyltransferase